MCGRHSIWDGNTHAGRCKLMYADQWKIRQECNNAFNKLHAVWFPVEPPLPSPSPLSRSHSLTHSHTHTHTLTHSLTHSHSPHSSPLGDRQSATAVVQCLQFPDNLNSAPVLSVPWSQVTVYPAHSLQHLLLGTDRQTDMMSVDSYNNYTIFQAIRVCLSTPTLSDPHCQSILSDPQLSDPHCQSTLSDPHCQSTLSDPHCQTHTVSCTEIT